MERQDDEKTGIPNFITPIRIEIKRHNTNEVYFLESLQTELSVEDLAVITQICNEETIYNRLFKKKLKNNPYTTNNAKQFGDWAKTGWETNKYFVFLIRDSNRQIVGVIDIKSANIESAQIGYWISQNHPGVMTNTLVSLCRMAEKAGFIALEAQTKNDNIKSQGVLKRAGFYFQGEVNVEEATFFRFSKKL